MISEYYQKFSSIPRSLVNIKVLVISQWDFKNTLIYLSGVGSQEIKKNVDSYS